MGRCGGVCGGNGGLCCVEGINTFAFGFSTNSFALGFSVDFLTLTVEFAAGVDDGDGAGAEPLVGVAADVVGAAEDEEGVDGFDAESCGVGVRCSVLSWRTMMLAVGGDDRRPSFAEAAA